MVSHPMPPQLPGYDFVRALGSGSTASVYEYHQRVPARDVAVKVSSSSLDPRAAARFRNEANFMAALSTHPYILSIYDAGVTSEGLGYIVLEFAPGGSYKEIMRTHPLDAPGMLDLGIKLAGALYCAHRRGIVHRDIKPANILITAQGLPVLADFGISTNVYQANVRTGFSYPWAAPEVLTGRSGGNEASDIYSLAATLFGILTGRSPFEYGYAVHTQDELAQIIVNRELPHLRRPDVPADVERVLRRAMSKDPDARYGSALEFARAMQRAQYRCYGRVTPVTAEGVPEYPDRLIERRGPDAANPAAPSLASARRNWVRPAAIAAGIAAVIAAIAIIFVTVVAPRLDASPSEDQSSRTSPLTEDDPGADKGGDGNDADADANADAVAGQNVPSPTNATGSYQGDAVTFAWTNPDPRQGDTYAWQLVEGAAADSSTDTGIVDKPTVTITDVKAAQTCIRISIVRSDRHMSTEPTIACAVRPQG